MMFGKLIFAAFLLSPSERVCLCEASTDFKTHHQKSPRTTKTKDFLFRYHNEGMEFSINFINSSIFKCWFSYLRLIRVQGSGCLLILQKQNCELCSNICPLNLVHIEIIVDLSSTHHRLASCFAQQRLREEIERGRKVGGGGGRHHLTLSTFS